MGGAFLAALLASAVLAENPPADELAGLWAAHERFGPDVRGTLTIAHDPDGWRGEIAGRTAPVTVRADEVFLTLAGGLGDFTGRFDAARAKIVGHWVQPPTVTFGARYASPITLVRTAEGPWRGEVVPLDDEFRFYLKISPRPDGSVAAVLRNPERNLARFVPIDSVEREGAAVRFLSAPAKGQAQGRVLAEGMLRDGVLTVRLPRAGGTYDFRRVEADEPTDYYPRGRPSVRYVYRPPRAGADGWPVASLEDVGISREAITRFIQMVIDTPMDPPNAVETHGVLIARHGKLVLEEYFHGEHAEKPHDTRSAAKSLTATLVGAAIQAGVPLSPSTSVYQTMNGGTLPAALEPRKRAMTLEHLLTMTSGYYCDDTDEKAPGREDGLLDQQDEPDYYKIMLGLPMESDPGTHPVYCSGVSHLIGGVLGRAAGKPLPVLFHERIAEPLEMRRYYLNLTPSGAPYMGGGVRFLPRDFMKLAQVHMDGGMWKGRRILSADWAGRSTSPLQQLRNRGYGYQWWIDERPYKGRMVRTFMAGGNGGQVAMAVPELDLVLGFWGGNYNDRTTYVAQNVYTPEWILPAVEEGK